MVKKMITDYKAYFKEYEKRRKEENESLVYADDECNMRKHYTKEDDEFIITSIQGMTMKDIGYALGRTEEAIKKRIWRLRGKGIIKDYKNKRKGDK